MEAPKNDAPKLPDMVMCGDHPSFTKTELNVKTDAKMDEKDKDKGKDKNMSYAKITPTPSRTERSERLEQALALERGGSEAALRAGEARRRVRELEVVQRPDIDVSATSNRALVQGTHVARVCTAALGSFRWPPYLLCVWVLVLVLTHVLHCLVSVLERALPAIRKCSQVFRAWTEETWRGEAELNQRVWPVALAAVTALLYALYFALYAAYAVVLWAIEPLCADGDDKRSATDLRGLALRDDAKP
ncbi:uncharacterized protein LOC110376722 isoform X2 [Helicoverpa armigera]|uniref:uncharacterized protein LOC110376722 isoform X2 n=1 Tax=Helicoverpa armigera TaxID=29058 RepID=UPI0030839E09